MEQFFWDEPTVKKTREPYCIVDQIPARDFQGVKCRIVNSNVFEVYNIGNIVPLTTFKIGLRLNTGASDPFVA